LAQLGRHFSLSDQVGSGVSCGKDGLFIGKVPLLQNDWETSASGTWQPRTVADLNRDLSKFYGLPVEFDRKIDGLNTVARALSRGDLIHAQIATLHLEIPDAPPLTKSIRTPSEVLDLAYQLQASGLLKVGWDPAKHPRWPAGSPSSSGGQFAPAGAASVDTAAGAQDTEKNPAEAQAIPAQLTIPAPLELPGGIPFPSDIMPPPVIPDIYPRELPKNPYPDRPECEEEWAEAFDYCWKLVTKNQLGRGDNRGSGDTLRKCIMGRVSERCGGNSTGA
jgi:hypothetical protein